MVDPDHSDGNGLRAGLPFVGTGGKGGHIGKSIPLSKIVEGKASGIERELVELLGSWNRIPVTYAGGIGSFQNLEELAEWGQHHLNYTIGSALDLFAGNMKFEDVLEFGKKL